MRPVLLSLLLLGAAAVGYAWLGWRVLTTRGLAQLIALAAAATVLCSLVLALRIGSLAGWGGARPGQIPATALIFAVLYACGFAGASVALRRHQRTQPTGSPPYVLGVLGFVAGIAVPLVLLVALDVVRVLGGEASQLSN